MNSEGFAQNLRDLPRLWAELGRTRQLVVGGVAGAVLVAIVAAVVMLQRPQNVALYTNLNDQDAAAIVAKLKELKIPYSLADGGATIVVPSNEKEAVRLQLASQGLPSGSGVGMVGMEVFDKTNLGITDFAQKLNYQRGLEGELTRTISRLAAVDSARVHLVLPQDRLFSSQQKDTTASVVLKLKPGAKLSDDQVSSVKFLVSKAVEGMKPENVAVVDVNGNTLGKLDSPEEARNKEATTRLEVQRQREQELERKVQGLLDQVLGANHSVVKASVALDWDQVDRAIEIFSPQGTQPQTRSQQDERENFAGQGADIAAPVGVPGTQANIPTYQASQNGQNSNYQRSKVTTNNELSSDKQKITRAAGEIKSIGIAVMVDQAVPAAQVDQIQQVVTAAAGLQLQAPARDQISVVKLPFDNSMAAQLKDQEQKQRIMDYVELGARVLGVMVALGGIFFLFRYLTGSMKPKEQPAIPLADQPALPGGTVGLLPEDVVQDQMQLMRAREAEVRKQIEEQARAQQRALRAARGEPLEDPAEEVERRNKIRDSVIKLAKDKPDVLAEVLSSWLDQGRAAGAPSARPA